MKKLDKMPIVEVKLFPISLACDDKTAFVLNEWCVRNCEGIWYRKDTEVVLKTANRDKEARIYWFQNEDEAAAFKLEWL